MTMITTFHLAVYFVYYVWNTYISRQIVDDRNGPSQNGNDPSQHRPSMPRGNGTNNTSFEDRPTNVHQNEEPNISPSPNESSSDINTTLRPADQNVQPHKNNKGNESKENLNPVQSKTVGLFSDDNKNASDLIINVKPEFRCVIIKKKVQFFPPAYLQRYMVIERILKEPKWESSVKKVVDFGCSELSFESRYLRKLPGIEEIIAVDIDLETLNNNCCKVNPSPCDFLDKRSTPLCVKVFCGSVAHTHNSLAGADAVIAIELIEHLFPPELDCLPFTVFGFIKPKIAIFTTPNYEFNKLFKGSTRFRHYDHKFEWTRQQFEDWAHNLVERYPDYQVTFEGIGPGPKGSEKLGCCSQLAKFIKVKDRSNSSDDIQEQDGDYTLIQESVFPFYKDERSEEEKIRDGAEQFLTHCKMRSRMCDELEHKIPLKAVMGRIEYHNEEKLKEILLARKWDVRKNSSGEEVIVFSDSEEDWEPEENDYFTTDNCDVNVNSVESPLVTEENWDFNESSMDMTLTDSCNVQSNSRESSNDQNWTAEEGYHSLDTVDIGGECGYSTNICSDVASNVSPTEKCPTLETTVPETDLSDRFSCSIIETVSEKDTNLNFEQSVYGTPYNIGFYNGSKSDCDCCLPLPNHTAKDCKRALIMDSPKEFVQFGKNLQEEGPSGCLSTLSSPCDTSIYATPCCSQRHRNNIPKCLSLQQINTSSSPSFGIELDTTLNESELVLDQKEKLSRSVEGVKSIENDLTCSSTSRVVDSGYPDSYSECNMDMDLTPEQFDDIETESEENDASSRSVSPLPLPPQVPRLVDDVQNGDVANNNRDGEGNNLVADMEEEALEFEARIDEINNDVLNLAAANDDRYLDHDMQLVEENCGDCVPCISDLSISDIPKDHQYEYQVPDIEMSKIVVPKDKNTIGDVSDSSDILSLRSTKSDSSIALKCSLNLDVSEYDKNTPESGTGCSDTRSNKLKIFNSLTTVLDGHSKFSNSSLVRPMEVYHVSENGSNTFSKPVSNEIRVPDQQDEAEEIASSASIVHDDDTRSLQSQSVYQSAESLNNLRDLQNTEFPDWLLNIMNLYFDEDEEESEDSGSNISVTDSEGEEPVTDSEDEEPELNYDVQIDARGGGEPLRETWR